MKYIRFNKDGQVWEGILRGEEICVLEGSFFGSYTETALRYRLDEVKLLPPTDPSKAVCVGLNYRDHANEMKLDLPETPVLFIKPTTCVIAAGEGIVRPALSKQVDYEGELVIVIGKKAKNVKKDEAASHILGYSIGNDVTARDLQPKDGQWTVCKGFDTFLPYGPVIETELDPGALSIRTLLNGQEKQSSNTKNLIFNCATLVSYISQVMTLLPGDIILTGTPSGIGPMQAGDSVSVEIEGIGTLTNAVI